MKSISIHVSEKAYRQFQIMAKNYDRPVAELIRQAMSEYLDRENRKKSLLDFAPRSVGKMLRKSWTRSELYDEMIRR